MCVLLSRFWETGTQSPCSRNSINQNINNCRLSLARQQRIPRCTALANGFGLPPARPSLPSCNQTEFIIIAPRAAEIYRVSIEKHAGQGTTITVMEMGQISAENIEFENFLAPNIQKLGCNKE